MGDFNATNNSQEDRKTLSIRSSKDKNKNQKTYNKKKKEKVEREPSYKPEISLFIQLEDRGFIDIHKNWEESILPDKSISHT